MPSYSPHYHHNPPWPLPSAQLRDCSNELANNVARSSDVSLLISGSAMFHSLSLVLMWLTACFSWKLWMLNGFSNAILLVLHLLLQPLLCSFADSPSYSHSRDCCSGFSFTFYTHSSCGMAFATTLTIPVIIYIGDLNLWKFDKSWERSLNFEKNHLIFHLPSEICTSLEVLNIRIHSSCFSYCVIITPKSMTPTQSFPTIY